VRWKPLLLRLLQEQPLISHPVKTEQKLKLHKKNIVRNFEKTLSLLPSMVDAILWLQPKVQLQTHYSFKDMKITAAIKVCTKRWGKRVPNHDSRGASFENHDL
jgi:hypothetical protein